VPKIKSEARDYMDMLMIFYSQKQLEPVQKPSGVSKAREQLIKALELRLDASLERLFRLLGLKYPPVEMYSAYRGIRSQDREMRLNAMEFLDNVLEINLKNILMPIIEIGTIRGDTTASLAGEDVPEEAESYIALLQGQDDFLKEKTLYLLSFMADDHYIPHMATLLNSPVREVRQMARFALEKSGRFQISSRYRRKIPVQLPAARH
jgi:AAA family ATP:ADP antiporter